MAFQVSAILHPLCNSLLNPEFFPSGHLQTAYSVIGDFSKIDKVEYDR